MPEAIKPSKEWKEQWNPNGCTLLPLVRDLIMQAYFATRGKGNEDYQPIWMPDLPLGPRTIRVAHDCRTMPKEALGGDKQKRIHSMGHMDVVGELFLMCEEPVAAQCVYTAVCHNCKAVFFSSAWDREDTLENYVKTLKEK